MTGGREVREKDCYAYLVNDLGMAGELADRVLADVQDQGWTEFYPAGRLVVAVAKIPAASGQRTSEYQVTVK